MLFDAIIIQQLESKETMEFPLGNRKKKSEKEHRQKSVCVNFI